MDFVLHHVVELEDLAEVHAGRQAKRCEYNVDGAAVSRVRHILLGEDAGNNALVAVAAGELVAHRHRAQLRDFNMDALDDAGVEVVALLAGKYFYADDAAALAVFHPQRAVFHIAGLVAEDAAQQALLGRQLGLAFGRNLADKDVAGADLGADGDDAVFVEVAELGFRNVRNVVSGFLGPELGVAYVADKLLDVDGGKLAVFDQALGDNDGVFVIGAAPAHKRDKRVLAQRQLAVVGSGGIGKEPAPFNLVADADAGALVQGGKAVGPHNVDQRVFGFLPFLVFNFDDAAVGVAYGAGLKRVDKSAGGDQRSLGQDAGRCLLLHVASHK